ncbi:MAG TPA: hypothetical protein VK833_11600 [Gillisia sp.]|nr:hypothetical protein [Gillisia sp.]
MYTTALKYGHLRMFKGVHYNELKEHVEEVHSLVTIHNWSK